MPWCVIACVRQVVSKSDLLLESARSPSVCGAKSSFYIALAFNKNFHPPISMDRSGFDLVEFLTSRKKHSRFSAVQGTTFRFLRFPTGNGHPKICSRLSHAKASWNRDSSHSLRLDSSLREYISHGVSERVTYSFCWFFQRRP